MKYFQKVLAIDRKTNNRVGLCFTMLNMGNIYFHQGEYDVAHQYYKNSLDESMSIGLKEIQGMGLGSLANCLYESGEYENARRLFRECVRIHQELGHKSGLLKGYGSLGMVEAALGEFNEALFYYEKSLLLARELKDRYNEALTLELVSRAYFLSGDLKNAGKKLDEAIELIQELKLEHYLPGLLAARSEIYFLDGQVARADEMNTKVRTMAEKYGQDDVAFKAEVLSAEIVAIEDRPRAIRLLKDMLARTLGEERLAEIHCQLYKITQEDEYRSFSLNLYKGLYNKKPDYHFRLRIEELR